MVGNRSAVGEQYVELQPQADTEPYLDDDSEIATENTRTPITIETLLTNLSNTVESVDKEALKTTVTEMGKAFEGTGQDLRPDHRLRQRLHRGRPTPTSTSPPP